MNHFTAEDTFIIVGIVIAYILFTTWLTFRIRSKNSGDFMEGSRAMPAFIVGILAPNRPSVLPRPPLRAELPPRGPCWGQPSAFRCSV